MFEHANPAPGDADARGRGFDPDERTFEVRFRVPKVAPASLAGERP